jgi:hypothetical protein
MAKPEDQEATMIANLAERTGRTLEQWRAMLRDLDAGGHAGIVRHLKQEHGVTHGYANLIAHRALSSAAAAAGPDALVDAQYAGSRAAARPIYEAVLRAVLDFGDEVEVAPKKTYVSLRRSKQFALLQPGAGRLDVGINAGDVPVTERLERSGSFNAMVSHRVRVPSVDDVDDELIGWLRRAYDRA